MASTRHALVLGHNTIATRDMSPTHTRCDDKRVTHRSSVLQRRDIMFQNRTLRLFDVRGLFTRGLSCGPDTPASFPEYVSPIFAHHGSAIPNSQSNSQSSLQNSSNVRLWPSNVVDHPADAVKLLSTYNRTPRPCTTADCPSAPPQLTVLPEDPAVLNISAECADALPGFSNASSHHRLRNTSHVTLAEMLGGKCFHFDISSETFAEF